jgi:hypothetical protein
MGLGQFGCFVHNAEITLDAAKNPPPRRAPPPGSPHSKKRAPRATASSTQFVLYPTLGNRIGPFREAHPPAPHRSSLLTDPTTPGLYEAITR